MLSATSLLQAAAALERLRQASLDRLAGTVPAAIVGKSMESMASLRKQHSPQPCLSKSAIAGIGGSRRGAGGSPGSSDGRPGSAAVSPPAVSRVDAAALLARSSSPRLGAPASDAPAKVSTPVAALLAESARIMSSIDGGQGGGFGSSFGCTGAAAASAAAEDDTAATPGAAEHPASAAAEEDPAGFSTPRENAVSLRWLEQQQCPPAAGQREQQAERDSQARHCRVATTADEETGSAAAPAAGGCVEPLMASQAAWPPARGLQHAASFSQVCAACAGSFQCRSNHWHAQLQQCPHLPVPRTRPPAHPLLQLRRRNLQQLSPTSTPLSSLGRQSSRGSSACSDDGLTPRSSLRAARGSMLQRSASPLGAGAAAVPAEARTAVAAHCSASATLCGQHECPADVVGVLRSQQTLELLGESGRFSAGRMPERLPKRAPEGPLLPAREFGASALHSRASSCDLTYYAPFSMDREGQGAFIAPEAQVGCHYCSTVEQPVRL